MSGEELYDVLNMLFSTAINDRPEERADGIRLLELAMKHGNEPSRIIERMHEMIAINQDARGKLYSAIVGKFWEREFRVAIPFRKFRFDEE